MGIWIDDSGVWVQLSLPELLFGCSIGGMRHFEAVRSGRKDRHGFQAGEQSGLGIHIEGACGEFAAAQALGREFSPTINNFKEADIGKNLQVKTRSRHDYDLLVRRDDNPEHWFLLVTGLAPLFCVRGWIKGSDAMKDCYLAAHGGREEAFFVPARDLRPLVKSRVEVDQKEGMPL